MNRTNKKKKSNPTQQPNKTFRTSETIITTNKQKPWLDHYYIWEQTKCKYMKQIPIIV